MKKLLLLIFSLGAITAFSQHSPRQDEVFAFPEKFVRKIERKAKKIDNKILKFSLKSYTKFQKLEKELEVKLLAKDSLLAGNIFNEENNLYRNFQKGFYKKKKNNSVSSGYISFIDSLTTTLNFLSESEKLFNLNEDQITQLSEAKENLTAVREQLLNATAIEKWVSLRKNILTEKLLSQGLGKEMVKYQKQLHYFSVQMEEYKSLLQDQGKIEREALKQLNKIPSFQQFMKENSQLAQMFRLPVGYGNPISLNDLQGRTEVLNIINSRSASNTLNNFRNSNSLNRELGNGIKNLEKKFNGLGILSNNSDLPDFKPNPEKTKLFFHRIEYGLNIQSVKRNSLLPATTDIAATAGYKINQKSIIGIGISYKLGWGDNFRKLSLSHEGIGLRTFIDYQIKGKIYLSGGYEKNYRSSFKDIENLKDLNRWQQSALIGIMKKYKIKSGLKGNVQVLFDFFHKENPPLKSPVLFRMGYNF